MKIGEISSCKPPELFEPSKGKKKDNQYVRDSYFETREKKTTKCVLLFLQCFAISFCYVFVMFCYALLCFCYVLLDFSRARPERGRGSRCTTTSPDDLAYAVHQIDQGLDLRTP